MDISVVKEMERMKSHWGTLTTREQIENISDYQNNLMYTPQHSIKGQACHSYLMNCGTEEYHRRRCEIALYRATGEISSFFLDKKLSRDCLIVDKVLAIAEEWRFLEGEGLLPLLDDFDIIQAFEWKSPPLSRAETLRVYMESYKVRRDITVWTTDNLNSLRHMWFKVRQGARGLRSQGKRATPSPDLRPTKRIKYDDEVVDGKLRHASKAIQEYAEVAQKQHGEMDKLVTEEFNKLLKPLRETQQNWTPESALAHAAAFKRFGLMVEKVLGNNLFFQLEKKGDLEEEADRVDGQLLRASTITSLSAFTGLSIIPELEEEVNSSNTMKGMTDSTKEITRESTKNSPASPQH